jgi:hypothetical protein
LKRRKFGGKTFGDFGSFNRLVVYGAGALFYELIAFDTEIETLGPCIQ